jgi:hypothetical protein
MTYCRETRDKKNAVRVRVNRTYPAPLGEGGGRGYQPMSFGGKNMKGEKRKKRKM